MATDRAAIVSELYRRRDTLPPDKQRVVDELARRFQITPPPAVLDAEQTFAAQPPGEPSILSQVGGAVRAGAMNPVAQTITEATGRQYVSLPERIEAGFRGKGGVRDIVQSGVRMLPKGVSDAIEQNPILQFAGDVVEEGAKGVGGLVEFMTSPLGVALPAVHRGLQAAQAAERLAGVTGQAGAARTAQAARAAEAAIGGAFGADMAPHTAEAVGQAIDDPSGRNIAAAGVAAGMNVLPAAGGRAVNQRAKAMEARNAAAETSRQVRAEVAETAMRDPVAAMGTREIGPVERPRPIPAEAKPSTPGQPGPRLNRDQRRQQVEPPAEPGPSQAEQMRTEEIAQTQAARKQYAEQMTGKQWADITNSELLLVDELIAEKRRAGQGILEGEKPPAPVATTPKVEAVAPKAEPVSVVEAPKPIEAPAVVPKTEQVKTEPQRGALSVEEQRELRTRANLADEVPVVANVVETRAQPPMGKPAGQPGAPSPVGGASNAPAMPRSGLDVLPAPRSNAPVSISAKDPQRRIVEMLVSDIVADPKRFQFKHDAIGKGGTGEEFRNTRTWDPELAGVMSVWRDPADGKTYVVNGHHRLEMAARLGVESVDVRYLKSKTATEARTKGALINIAEGKGSPIDAAKVFRDGGFTPEQLDRMGISLKGKLAADGVALSRLHPSVFDMVAREELSVRHGSIIGEAGLDLHSQKAVVAAISERINRNQRVSDEGVREMVRRASKAGEHTEQTMTLFGEDVTTRSLLGEESELVADVRRRLGQEKRLFGIVGKQAAADRLGRAGNKLEVEANAQISEQASQALAVFDKLVDSAGPVSDAIQRGAKEIADGKPAARVREQAYESIRTAVSDLLNPRRKGSVRGVDDGGIGGGRGATAPDALTRAETAARERLNSAFKGDTLSANPAALIGDVAIVGVAKLRRGVQKFSDWSREMVAELGERIKPYLAKAWVQARKLYRDERGTAPIIPGERLDPLPDPENKGGKPAKVKTKAATPDQPGLVASTSLLKTKDNIVKRLSLSDETKQTIQAKIDEYAAKNPDLRPVGFEEIKAEARALDPSLVADLNISKMKPGETLNPAVRFAAREALNAIQDKAQAKTKELREYANRESADPAKIMDMEREVGALEFESKRLIDVLLPTRSQDGRNLAYHRMMAEKSFDAEYWLHRAKRAAGIPPGREYSLPKPLADAINEATAEGRAAEQAATAKAKTLPEGRQKDAIENDPGVKAARRKLAKTLMVAEKTSLLDTITALRRAGLLTGVKTHLRNIGGNTAFQVMEEVARIPGALVDGALATGTGRRTTFTADIRAVGKASYAAATRGVREARQVMRDGATAEQLAKLDVRKEINTGNKVIDTYVNTVFRSLGAEDRIFKTYAYERSLAERMKAEKVKEPTQAMILEALNDADFATFNNPNSAAQFVSRGKSAVGPGGRFVVDFFVPFQNTPANIIARVIEYSGGGAISSTVALARARGAISKLDPAAQRQISMGVGRSMVGWALMYAGYKMAEAGLMTGASQEDPGQRELNRAAGRLNGAIKVGDTWQTISALAPGGNMLTIGASMWEAASNPKREKKGAGSVALGILGVGTKTVMEQPMLKGMQDAIDALERPDSTMEYVAASAAGSFVPTIVADVTSVFDDKMREARGVTRGVANRLPGTRNQLPPRIDALGRDIPQSKSAAINPGIGSEAIENKNPVVREMVRLRAPLSGLRRREEEPDKAFTERQRLVGRAVATAVKGVMDSPVYPRLSDDERRDAVSMAAGRIKAKITTILGRANYDKLSEAERLRILTNLKESLNR